jgi:hypothetical protein
MSHIKNPDYDEIRRRIEVGARHADTNSDVKRYSAEYPQLLEAAGLLVKFSSNPINTISLLAYGWMPTIKRETKLSRFSRSASNVATDIQSIRSSAEGREFLTQCTKEAPISNSWIGTSKVLHLINPEVFPIWDNNVSRALDGPVSWQGQSTREAYVSYFNRIHDLIERRFDRLDCMKHFEDADETMSSCRLLELCLFSFEKKARSERP